MRARPSSNEMFVPAKVGRMKVSKRITACGARGAECPGKQCTAVPGIRDLRHAKVPHAAAKRSCLELQMRCKACGACPSAVPCGPSACKARRKVTVCNLRCWPHQSSAMWVPITCSAWPMRRLSCRMSVVARLSVSCSPSSAVLCWRTLLGTSEMRSCALCAVLSNSSWAVLRREMRCSRLLLWPAMWCCSASSAALWLRSMP